MGRRSRSSGSSRTRRATSSPTRRPPWCFRASSTRPECSGQALGTTTLLYSPTTGAKGGSTFRYDSGTHQFIFNWDTGYMPGPGCYELELQLNDGSPIKATVEQLN